MSLHIWNLIRNEAREIIELSVSTNIGFYTRLLSWNLRWDRCHDGWEFGLEGIIQLETKVEEQLSCGRKFEGNHVMYSVSKYPSVSTHRVLSKPSTGTCDWSLGAEALVKCGPERSRFQFRHTMKTKNTYVDESHIKYVVRDPHRRVGTSI